MMKFVSLKAPLAVLIFCACLIGSFLGGYLSQHTFVGQHLHRVVDGDFSTDTWIGERAEIVVPGFAGGLNYLDLSFEPVRVGAQEPPRISISVCGRTPMERLIDSSNPVRVWIPLGCSPAKITVSSLNFFIPSGVRDRRALGVQLKSLRVRSLLKLPIVDFRSLFSVSALMVALALLISFVATRAGLPGLKSAFVAILVGSGAVLAIDVAPDKWEPVSIVLLGMLTGMAVYSIRNTPGIGNTSRRGGFLLCAALLVGAALRLYGISFGLPSNFHPDEVPKVNAIMRMVDQNSFDPQYFLHPSLLLYLTYATNSLLHMFGLQGEFRDTAFLAGRLVSATAGLISICLTYLIGRRLFSGEVGGVAACLLAVFPLHVTCSRYLKEDSLLTFIVLLCALTTLVAVQSNRKWLLLLAGLLAGCTAGAKYSGILMVVVPASAPWIASRSIKPDKKWLVWALAACLIAPLGFLITTPYAVLNSTKFIKDFSSESRHMQTGHTVSITAWSQLWLYHFWRSIWPGISGVAAILSCIAMGFLLRRGRLEDLVVIGMTMLFYLPAEFVKAKPAPQPERYILPCLPFIAIAIAELMRQLACQKSLGRRILITSCAVLAVAAPLWRSVVLARDINYDTRDEMAQWMKANLPQGSKVLMDWKPYCPNFHGEYFTVEHIPRARIILELDVPALRSSGAQYLVLSSLFYNRYFSQPEAQPTLRQRFREVFQRVPIVKQFEAPAGTYGFHNPTLTLFSLNSDDFARLDEERNRKLRGEIEYTSNEVRARAKW